MILIFRNFIVRRSSAINIKFLLFTIFQAIAQNKWRFFYFLYFSTFFFIRYILWGDIMYKLKCVYCEKQMKYKLCRRVIMQRERQKLLLWSSSCDDHQFEFSVYCIFFLLHGYVVYLRHLLGDDFSKQTFLEIPLPEVYKF